MSDLISRKAAIDAVRRRFSMPVDNLIVEVIGNLPSAEPEIIRCEDCKNYVGEWCKEINDSPYPDMPRNCEYFAKKERFDYGQRVHDKVTGFCGKVTGYVRYYGIRPEQYLVESIDATGRPIEQWVDENRLEKGTQI